jgi:hypothetical protein
VQGRRRGEARNHAVTLGAQIKFFGAPRPRLIMTCTTQRQNAPDSLVDFHTGEEGAKDESKGESKDESKEGAE